MNLLTMLLYSTYTFAIVRSALLPTGIRMGQRIRSETSESLTDSTLSTRRSLPLDIHLPIPILNRSVTIVGDGSRISQVGGTNASASDLKGGSDTLAVTGAHAIPIIRIYDNTSFCGPPGATLNTSSLTGPNGSIDWLNCGISGDSGWRPPLVRVADVSAMNLSYAVTSESSPFRRCERFLEMFEKYGEEFDVPPIFLASFAMQESSCKPDTVGHAGEQGLMQLTKDKCTGAPGGDCLNPEYNIRSGAAFFSDTLRKNKGGLLLTIGEYNGWSAGMTLNQATATAHADASSRCCRCQNNLDYLHQFLNGWCQNINVYAHKPPLGKFFNLASCD